MRWTSYQENRRNYIMLMTAYETGLLIAGMSENYYCAKIMDLWI